MKDILFSLIDAGHTSLLHVWVVFILPITLLFVNVATWLTSRAVITHVNYSVCVLMFDKRKNFFFFDSGYKMRKHWESGKWGLVQRGSLQTAEFIPLGHREQTDHWELTFAGVWWTQTWVSLGVTCPSRLAHGSHSLGYWQCASIKMGVPFSLDDCILPFYWRWDSTQLEVLGVTQHPHRSV